MSVLFELCYEILGPFYSVLKKYVQYVRSLFKKYVNKQSLYSIVFPTEKYSFRCALNSDEVLYVLKPYVVDSVLRYNGSELFLGELSDRGFCLSRVSGFYNRHSLAPCIDGVILKESEDCSAIHITINLFRFRLVRIVFVLVFGCVALISLAGFLSTFFVEGLFSALSNLIPLFIFMLFVLVQKVLFTYEVKKIKHVFEEVFKYLIVD